MRTTLNVRNTHENAGVFGHSLALCTHQIFPSNAAIEGETWLPATTSDFRY